MQSPEPSAPAGGEVDVETRVEAALARIMAAASDRPPGAAQKEGDTGAGASQCVTPRGVRQFGGL